ncbi:hypothetical protein [Streptomyces sp. HUAS TT7]
MIVHLGFIVSAVALAMIDKLMPGHALDSDSEPHPGGECISAP